MEPTQPPIAMPDRWAELRDGERERLLFLSRLSDEEIEALVTIAHDRLFWSRLRKKVKGLSAVIITISGVIIAITSISQGVLGWFTGLFK